MYIALLSYATYIYIYIYRSPISGYILFTCQLMGASLEMLAQVCNCLGTSTLVSLRCLGVCEYGNDQIIPMTDVH